MEGSDRAADFVTSGLASLGVEATEQELAVMRAAHALYWPAFRALMALDLGAMPAEPGADLSRAPRDR
jgi:hypothetical protein